MRYMGQSVTHMVSFCLRGFRGGSHLRLPQLFPRALTSPTVTQRVLHTKSLSKLIFLSLGLLSLWYITNDTFLSDHLRLLGSLPDEPFSQSADKSLGPYPFRGRMEVGHSSGSSSMNTSLERLSLGQENH